MLSVSGVGICAPPCLLLALARPFVDCGRLFISRPLISLSPFGTGLASPLYYLLALSMSLADSLLPHASCLIAKVGEKLADPSDDPVRHGRGQFEHLPGKQRDYDTQNNQ
jgi:hypothetical protein